MSTDCLIALGGNVGDVLATFERALAELRATPGILAITGVSSWHRTVPVGEQAGAMYWDGAATLQTSLSPLELLDVLQETERRLGRVRTVHWGPRTLDLDLILYGREQVREPRLVVPHPACWFRRFVLDPAVEVAAEWWHPERGLTLLQLRDRLLVRPLPIVLAGGTHAEQQTLCAELSQVEPHVRWLDATVLDTGDLQRRDPQASDRERGDVVSMAVPAKTLPRWPTVADAPLVIWWQASQPGQAGSDIGWHSLPVVSRYELVSEAGLWISSLRDIARAALGE